jgi:hypothetical protein
MTIPLSDEEIILLLEVLYIRANRPVENQKVQPMVGIEPNTYIGIGDFL